MPSANSATSPEKDAQAVRAAMDAYFAQVRARVSLFVATHYGWRGAWRLHRHALGADLLRAPLNVLLALPALVLRLLVVLLRLLRARRASEILARSPLALPTAVEGVVGGLVMQRLFRLSTGASSSPAQFVQVALRGLSPAQQQDAVARLQAGEFESRLRVLVARYAETRGAAADLSCALFAGLAGLWAFNQFTPGSLSSGRALAGALARETSVRDFWLGNTAGGWFYSVFPPQASVATVLLSIGGVMLVMSLAAAFAGVVADPVQARLGLHRRRLRALVASVERAARPGAQAHYNPKDHYYARITDLVDAIRAWLPG